VVQGGGGLSSGGRRENAIGTDSEKKKAASLIKEKIGLAWGGGGWVGLVWFLVGGLFVLVGVLDTIQTEYGDCCMGEKKKGKPTHDRRKKKKNVPPPGKRRLVMEKI